MRALVDIVQDLRIRCILGLVGLVPGRPGNMLADPVRVTLARLAGMRIGRGSQISPGFMLFRSGRFEAGEGCRFGYGFQVWNFNEFRVGARLLASHGVKIICGTHQVTALREDVAGPIVLGDDVWLGANVTIVGPCRIGDGVVVGAHSFVTGDLEAGWVYAGTPARRIRTVSPAVV